MPCLVWVKVEDMSSPHMKSIKRASILITQVCRSVSVGASSTNPQTRDPQSREHVVSVHALNASNIADECDGFFLSSDERQSYAF